jgi:hypothetical protein
MPKGSPISTDFRQIIHAKSVAGSTSDGIFTDLFPNGTNLISKITLGDMLEYVNKVMLVLLPHS